MSLRTWRFAALVLTALTLGMGFCHVMEMPARMSWEEPLWVAATVTGGLYRMFGTLGAAINLAAIGAAFVAAYRLRGRGRVFTLSLVAAGLYLVALVIWFAVVFPANLELARWLNGSVPPDWWATRLRWESGHAISAAFMFAGFCVLLRSVLIETPERP
jgi:hypothetical protein